LRRGTFDAVYEAVLALTTLSSLIKPLASVVTGARSDHIGLMALTLENLRLCCASSTVRLKPDSA